MHFLESDFKRICPLTCFRSPRKVFVDIRERERYTYSNINVRVRHRKRYTLARNSLFLFSPFRKKEIWMIFNEKLSVSREALLLSFIQNKERLMFETVNLLFFFCKSFCLFFMKKYLFFFSSCHFFIFIFSLHLFQRSLYVSNNF